MGDSGILAMGATRDVRPMVGPSTRVIDLRGRTVTPGFGDAHVHPPMAGLAGSAAPAALGLDRYLAADRGLRRRQPLGALDPGWRWTSPTSRAACRAVRTWIASAGPPVFLPNRDGHDAWVNSRALEVAGITGRTAGVQIAR